VASPTDRPVPASEDVAALSTGPLAGPEAGAFFPATRLHGILAEKL
jgi:hypothetical protein